MCKNCLGKSKNKIIVLFEKGTSTQLTIDNTEKLEVVHKVIDGCAVISGERCDHYLQIKKQNRTSHVFIELKGCNVEKAANQITTTINSGIVIIRKSDHKHAAIVSTRNPLNSTETARIKKKMLMQEHTLLHFYKMKANEKIDKFL